MSRNFGKLLGATLVACLGVGELTNLATLLASVCSVNATLGNIRGDAVGRVGLNGHDYVPTIMKDGSVYKMWWCSNNNNSEDIMYSEATNLEGPWTFPLSVLQPSAIAGRFDATHTCDPSVIRVNGTYYLYYGGLDSNSPNPTTRIGVASSTTGTSFSRMNGGNPIVVPARDPASVPNNYGAGQPSVVYVEGYFYMMFTDSTAIGSNPPMGTPGAGQFVRRSPDPAFQVAVTEMTGPGVFEPYNPAAARPWGFFVSQGHLIGFSVDWTYVDATNSFVIADAPFGNFRLSVYNGSLGRRDAEMSFPRPAQWIEGPGIVHSPEGHEVSSGTCGVIPFDLMRGIGATIEVTDIGHAGADWQTGLPCDCTSAPTLNAFGYPAIEDFNGDGFADLANHHRSTGNFQIRRNLGTSFDSSPWTTGATPPTPGWNTLVADFNGDTLADYADHHIASGQVWVHLKTPGGFDPNTWAFGYTAISANIEVLPGDFDGDGRADLLEHNRRTGQLTIRKNMGASMNAFIPVNVGITFRSQNGASGQDWRIAVGDFNGDNFVDIVDVYIPTFTFWVHQNVGGYQFNPISWNPVSAFNWPNFTTVFGDFNGDGYAEYADVNRGTGEIWAHRNQTNQTFDQVNNLIYGIYPIGGGGQWILGLPVSF